MNLGWLQNRRDPRAIFATSLVVAIVGIPGSIIFLRQGMVATVYIIVWLVVVVGQLIWASLKLCWYISARS